MLNTAFVTPYERKVAWVVCLVRGITSAGRLVPDDWKMGFVGFIFLSAG
jgi:hypothetical protein